MKKHIARMRTHIHKEDIRKRWKHLMPVLTIVAGIGLLSIGGLIIWASVMPMPDFNSFIERKIAQSTKIYDRTGDVLLYDIHEDIRRTLVESGSISPYIKNATVAIEDSEFYNHNGVRPVAFIRAALVNMVTMNFSQGGSTITQQVIKNTMLTREKTISRKVREWILALRLERLMNKEQILTLYLNESPYGGNIYGVQEAAKEFFGKNASDVSLAEAAYLAALPQAPTFYSPYGNHVDRLTNRQHTVLARMKELGMIDDTAYTAAINEKVTFKSQSRFGLKAPHFVFYVRSYIEEKYGATALEEDGLKITTTLDWKLQEKAQEIVKRNALQNEQTFNAKNAGLVAIDPKTGQIITMVGSRDYADTSIDGNFNVAIDPNRQPGSAFKPFVYAAAFAKGYTPDTVLFDLPTVFDTRCSPTGVPTSADTNSDDCYSPVNYDGKYRGPVTMREALAQSLNIPAVKTLYLAGLQNSLDTAKAMGITGLKDKNRYGLTLVLGGGEVSLLDMTSAYGVFARDGKRSPTTPILRIETKDGKVLEEYTPSEARVISEGVARQISDVLSDNIARAPAFGDNSYLNFPERDVAVKTGTTNDYRDAWIIGYIPQLSVGAWAGNNDNSPMEKKVAGYIVAPMWNEFMQTVLATYSIESFSPAPETPSDLPPILRGIWKGGVTYTIDTLSGGLATEYTPKETREERAVTGIHSILYWIDKDNPTQRRTNDPSSDPQFHLWEYPVRIWAAQNGYIDGASSGRPSFSDTVHTPGQAPTLTIEEPGRNSIHEKDERITIKTTSSSSLKRVDFFLNGAFLGSSTNTPFSFSFVPSLTEGIRYDSTITAVGYDMLYNKGETSVSIAIDGL
ncbi:MAG: PBP1A family penicillin-binding protein [Candidatus Yonathbacteria bacterium]|nr:PBP1A family penicillin-binding protein [Candidatus Yonathbacteria bacterium]